MYQGPSFIQQFMQYMKTIQNKTMPDHKYAYIYFEDEKSNYGPQEQQKFLDFIQRIEAFYQ